MDRALSHSHISYHGSPASVFSVWWCNPFARSAGKFKIGWNWCKLGKIGGNWRKLKLSIFAICINFRQFLQFASIFANFFGGLIGHYLFNRNLAIFCKFATFAKFLLNFHENCCFFKPIFCEKFEIAAVQKDANLVELEKCCRTHIFLQKISFWYSRERARQKFAKFW